MSNTPALSNCGSRLLILYTSVMRRSRNFCQRGSNFDNVFLVDERRDDQNTTKSGQSSAHQRNAISMAFRWRPDDGLTLNSGLVALRFSKWIRTNIAKKTFFVIFQGGGGGSVPPVAPLWIRPCQSRNFQPCRDVSWVEPVPNKV